MRVGSQWDLWDIWDLWDLPTCRRCRIGPISPIENLPSWGTETYPKVVCGNAADLSVAVVYLHKYLSPIGEVVDCTAYFRRLIYQSQTEDLGNLPVDPVKSRFLLIKHCQFRCCIEEYDLAFPIVEAGHRGSSVRAFSQNPRLARQ